jgi:hypothetical protein
MRRAFADKLLTIDIDAVRLIEKIEHPRQHQTPHRPAAPLHSNLLDARETNPFSSNGSTQRVLLSIYKIGITNVKSPV